jgi:hypothetical protein
MNVDQLKRDVKKELKKTPLNQELSPGTTGRRWTPPGGLKSHKEKIHRESIIADDHKDLPFSFNKPNKPKGRSTYVKCDNCDYITSGTTVTVGMVCPECHSFSTVTEVEVE